MATDAPPILLPCAICARTFKPLSLEKHAKICEKTAIKKRKPFDSAKQRIQGTDLAEFLPVQNKRRISHEDKISKPKSSWKQTHDEFLQAIRAARGDVDDVSRLRHAAPIVSTAAPTRANEKGTCPTCNRQFGIKAYDRHVAWCRERSNRLPVNAATNIAKERLEARIKYRAPALKNRKITNREKYSPGSAVSLSTTEKILPSITGSKPKESMSVPSCVKTNDSPSKPKPVTGRRLGQHREPLNTSGPMKSRLMDRTNRPTEEFESGPTSTRTSSSYPRCFELPSASLKSKNTVTKITSPPLKCIRKPDITSNFLPSSFKTSSPGVESFKTRINLISSRSYNGPKLNDVAVNREIVEMTVRPCNIYRDHNLTSWKQIGNTKSETFAGRRFSLDKNNVVDSIDAEQEVNPDDVIQTPTTRRKINQRDDTVGRLKSIYHQISATSQKHDTSFQHSTEFDKSKLLLAENVAKLDESYSIKESPDSEDSLDCSEFKWKPVKYSPKIEFFAKEVKMCGLSDSVPINDETSLNSELHVTCTNTEKESGKPFSENFNPTNEKIPDSNHREESETRRSRSPGMNETRISDFSLESPREVCYQLPETPNTVLTPINMSPQLSNEKSFHLQTSTPNKSPQAECSSSNVNNRISRKKTKNNRTGGTYRKIWRFGRSAGSNKRSKNCATGGNINCMIDLSSKIPRSNEVFSETVHNVCSSATGIENITHSSSNTPKLNVVMDTKRCGTYVIERKSLLSAKHHASDESPDDKPTHKRRKTEITDSSTESRTQTDISMHRNNVQHPKNAETPPKIFLERTGMAGVASCEVNREVRDEFVDKNFDYNSDDVSVVYNRSNDESDKERSSLRETDTSKDASFENCNVIVSHPVIDARCSLIQASNRPDSFDMKKSIQRNMNILKESTDSLVSSVDAKARGSRLIAPSGCCEKEICTIRSIGNNSLIRNGGTSTFLPVIRHHGSINKLSVMEKTYECLPKRALSYWDKSARNVERKLMTIDPPKTTFRLTKRNSQFHFLPSMNPFNPSVLESSSGTSQDYDPFLAAERQMNELFEGTGEQFLTECSPTNSPNYPSNSTNVAQFPLSHSSAFVKYPSSPPANKRASVIAPPSEFDDFTSDFSSDSTETNSVTQEFFINNLNEQTREIDELDKLTRDCNRRVVIDKSKAVSDNDVNANSSRGKTFVSSVERSRKILEKVSPKVTRPTVNRSHSVRSSRAASAPRAPERKSSLKKITSQKNDYTNVFNPTNNNDSYSNLSGSNLSLISMPSSDVDIKRSNSVFDELLSSFEDDSSSFPSLKSFLKSDSISTSMSSPLQGSRPRNGMISDEELSSPDSYKRRDHSKMSADSAYSSLNRKCSNHGRSTTDVGSRLDEETAPKRREASITSTKLKMSKFCHECGSRFPESAKFCCECGIKRLCL